MRGVPRHALAEAVRAQVADICVVAPLVEQAADLVHPAVAVVALHPGLLLFPVVFALHDVHLLDALPIKLHHLPLLVHVALVAPVALQLLDGCRRVVGLRATKSFGSLQSQEPRGSSGVSRFMDLHPKKN